jgi:cbb3-type cytochrome oxidase subunit 1
MEMQDRFIRRWVLVALVYFVAAVSLGVFMAATHDFRLKGVHVHLNLLGWVSMALFGLIYSAYPAAGQTKLATWHFWIHNLTLPVFMALLFAMLSGNPALGPAVGLVATVTLIGIVLFAVNLWRTIPAAT